MKDAQYKLIVDGARRRGATFPTQAAWLEFKAAVDAAVGLSNQSEAPSSAPKAPSSPSHRRISAKGKALIHSFEQCRLTTYPDPGSKDGKPVTGGWGSTCDENGNPLRLGFTAPQAYWDALFEKQIAKYEQAVDRATAGVPTTQNAFDAMVSLAYNIGIKGFQGSTVLRKHKAGDHPGAARAFLMWNKNDGKVMRGLTRRRLAESDLYDD